MYAVSFTSPNEGDPAYKQLAEVRERAFYPTVQ